MGPKRRADQPTSPSPLPKHSSSYHNNHQGHKRQLSHPHTSSGPSLQHLHAVHDAPASLEQLNALNLPVLQRFIPSLHRIVSIASYCTVYKIVGSEWDRADIEGPLFLLELNPYHPQFVLPNTDPPMEPSMGRYHAFIMNRKGITNLLIPLPKRSDDVDTTNSELISMLMSWGDCYGLRIYEEEGTSTASERERVGKEVAELTKMTEDEENMKNSMGPVPGMMGFPPMTSTGGGHAIPTMAPGSGIDLMGVLGRQIGAGNTSGYASGDGGYTSGGSGAGGGGRKISLQELFGKPLGQ